MSVFRISHPTSSVSGRIVLDGSKSISNRVLIIRSLCKSHFDITNLSKSDDTRTLEKLLDRQNGDEYDVGHAGTTFRFLTAFLAFKPGTQFLTGSHRMKERPIGPLVDALRTLGAKIEYSGHEGYPPLLIHTPDLTVNTSRIAVKSDISSQYLTALMLLAPTLPNGLTIDILGDLVSESYLLLTVRVLRDFGIDCVYNGKTVSIPSQAYIPRPYQIEADWSACSYYYAIAAIANEAEIKLSGLFENSGQGDSALTKIGNLLGIKSEFSGKDLILSKNELPKSFSYNFINQPDIAQTIAVICAARGVSGKFRGLKTLRIKETDRISALDTELSKVNVRFVLDSGEGDNEEYKVEGMVKSSNDHPPRFDTYHDHRMAMSFAPLSLVFPIEIRDPMVVTKSYPAYWEDLRKLGFEVEEMS